METNPQALLAAISQRWALQAETQTTVPAVAAGDEQAGEEHDNGQATCADLSPDEPTFVASTTFTVCAKAGELCGRRCKDIDSAARHLVHMIRNYPFRPYLTTDGGVYIRVAASVDWQAENEELIGFFHRLWWTAAGDAVCERFRDRLPMREPVRPALYGLPRWEA